MPTTTQSRLINASIDETWQKFRNFHEISWAEKVLFSCEKVGEIRGDMAGAKRILNHAFHETLIEIDPTSHSLKYSIDDGPSPVSKDEVSNYIGAVQMTPNPDGNGTLVVWSSSWDSNSEDAVAFCSGIYVALLNELAETFA